MLETVKTTIKNVPFITFEEYFIQYVMYMQDANIDNEVTFVMRNNSLTPLAVDKLIHNEVLSDDKLRRLTTSL